MQYDQIENKVLDVMNFHFEKHNLPQDVREANLFHVARYALSVFWLQDLVPIANRILELGSPSISTDIVKHFFPSLNVTNTDFDLRQSFPYPDQSFDLILNMEVIEHIFDLAIAHATVTLSGVKHVLSECYRVLNEGGKMFLTTPNASSLWAIQRILLSESPMSYPYHFREFSYSEIIALLKEAGFEIEKSAAEKVWHHWDFRPIEAFISVQGYSNENRGDDTFVIASKGNKVIDSPKEISSRQRLSPDRGNVYFRLGFRMFRYALYSSMGGDANRVIRHLRKWLKTRQERKKHL